MIYKATVNKLATFNSKLDMSQKIIINLIVVVVICFFIDVLRLDCLRKGFFMLTLIYWSFSVFYGLVGIYKNCMKQYWVKEF
jgi:hypothetical protein